MHHEGNKTIVSEQEASGGAKPHIVRYVLIISLALAILAMSAAWITGAIAT